MKPLRAGLAVLALSFSVFAQDPQQDPETLLQTAQTRLQGLADPQTEEDKNWQQLINARIGLLQDLIATRRAAGEITTSESVAQRKAAAEASLETERAKPEVTSLSLSDPAEADAYESSAQEATRARDTAQKAQQDLETELSDLTDERGNLTERQAALAPRLEQTPEGGDEQGKYGHDNARLERALLSEREDYIADKIPSLNDLKPILQLELELAELRRSRAQASLDLAREQVTRLNEAAAAEARAQAAEAERAAEQETDPIESFRQRIAAEVQNSKAEEATLRTQITSLSSRRDEEKEAIDWIQKESSRVEDRFALRGTEDVQVVRRTLLSVQRAQNLLVDVLEPDIESQSRELQADLANLLDRLWDLQLPEDEGQALPKFLEEVSAQGVDREAEARRAFKETVLDPEGLVAHLVDERETIEEAQSVLDEVEQLMDDRQIELEGLSALIARQLLWRHDEPLLSGPRLENLGEEFSKLFTTAGSSDAGEAFRATGDGNRNLLFLVLGLLLFGIWPYVSSAIRKPVHVWGLRWLTLALLRVFPIPIAFWLLSQICAPPRMRASCRIWASSSA